MADYYPKDHDRKSYFAGAREALELYAWWKDGTQYVGCGVKTLRQALEDVNKQEIGET